MCLEIQETWDEKESIFAGMVANELLRHGFEIVT